ncbi:MAG: hypothetical protein K6L76_06515 [Agarilytica sp.]
MSFNIAFFPILALLIGFSTMFVVIKILSKEVSRERLNSVEDLGALWKTSFPPSQVLTDRGLKIQRWYRIFVVVLVLLATVVGVFVTGFSNSPITAT